jgi:ornithine cyclodeaminase/alanine dehydrogenase-like protein (mu-crystallin family)
MGDAMHPSTIGVEHDASLLPALGAPRSRAPSTLILSRREVASLMGTAAYLEAVEAGFRAYANGEASVPLPMHIPAPGGGFHAKGALMALDRSYAGVKLNANFPDNPRRKGLPTIQGALLLCDASDGSLLAVIDSVEITLRRTAAASVLAARYLARADSTSIAICGCGQQGRAQLAAFMDVFALRRAKAWDIDPDRARDFAREMSSELGVGVTAVGDVRDAARDSDIVVTATTATTPFLGSGCIVAGTFVAAVGADSAQKNELTAELLAHSRIVVDIIAQSATMGDLHHAIEAGLVGIEDVHAELGDLVTGRRSGRADADEITVFDSTGVAIQDVASAAWIYRRAIAAEVGTLVSLSMS